MRWWLALLFAGIAALTAVVVAQVFQSSSESAIRERVAELTAGTAVAGASRIASAPNASAAQNVAADVATRRRIALFVFDAEGRLATSDRVAGTELADVRALEAALAESLAGRRYVETDDTGAVTVALPIRGNSRFAAIVAFANRPDLEEALGIVQDEIIDAALRATLVGALLGLVVAALITRRLRRITAAATAVEQGSFEGELRPGFPDELGALAQTVDQMREQLARSFGELEGERDRLRKLLEQLQEGVVAMDRSRNIVFANTRARHLLGSDAREGSQLPDPWPGVGLQQLVARLFDREAQPISSTIRPDAETTLVVGGVPPSAGSDIALLVLTDVTQRERRERAEREFVANAAHELRTPLTAIGSAVDVLQSGVKDNAAQRSRFVDVIARQSRRLNGLVEALLTLARAQTDADSVRLDPVDVSHLLARVKEDVEHERRLHAVDCEPGLVALAHADLLRQALLNLIENAFTHGQGNEVVLSAHSSGAMILIEVRDLGPGMPARVAERVLDRFYRGEGSQGGYGLGLAIVREVARAIDGRLWITTKPGEGTTVSLELARVVTK